MQSATAWFAKYGESHQNGINKLIHWICIPVIFVSTLGLLQAIPFPVEVHPLLHWGTVVSVLVLAFYFRLSLTLGIGMALAIGASLVVTHGVAGAGLPLAWTCAGAFFVAWVFQFIGHKIEGKKPSFFQDLQFLLVGPAWLLQFAYGRLGIPVETWRGARDDAPLAQS